LGLHPAPSRVAGVTNRGAPGLAESLGGGHVRDRVRSIAPISRCRVDSCRLLSVLVRAVVHARVCARVCALPRSRLWRPSRSFSLACRSSRRLASLAPRARCHRANRPGTGSCRLPPPSPTVLLGRRRCCISRRAMS
jgi:hypothetical protein